MRNISQFFTKQSISYLVSLPAVFSILKNWQDFIRSYISWNLTISQLVFRNWYIYPIKNFDDLWVFYEIFVKKEYGLIPKWYKNIIDIWANNGLFMLYCKWQNPEATIHCFEPVPQCASSIRDLIKVNNLQDVVVHEIAISDSEWEVSIFLDTQTIAATLHKNIAWGTHEIKVKTSLLSNQIQTLWLQHIDFLKMDCEWSEYEIIDSLSVDQIMMFTKIIIEWHNVDTNKTGIALFETLKTKANHKHITYTTHEWHANNWFIKIYN